MMTEAVDDLIQISKQLRVATKGKGDKNGQAFKFPNYESVTEQ